MTDGTGLLRECHVWWARPSAVPTHLVELLDEGERARSTGFGRSADRLRYVAGRALARVVLGRYLDHDPAAIRLTAWCKRCGKTSHGKPRLSTPDADLEMSLSHSGDRVAVAVTRGVPVGVDVQELTPNGWPLTPHHMLSASERQCVDALPRPERAVGMIRYWTRKEAVLKATGDGLASPLTRLTVSGPNEPPQVLGWEEGPRLPPIYLSDLHPGKGFVACAAMLTNGFQQFVERDGESLLWDSHATLSH